MRAALAAALLLAAAPLAGTASARCAEPFVTVCSAYLKACAEVRDVDPTGRLCAVQP